MTNDENYKKKVDEKVKSKSYSEYATEVNIFVQEYNMFWKMIKDFVIKIKGDANLH